MKIGIFNGKTKYIAESRIVLYASIQKINYEKAFNHNCYNIVICHL